MFRMTRRAAIVIAAAASGALGLGAKAATRRVSVRRLVDHPIIAPGMDVRMGPNIEGPSLIRTPTWLPGRLGRYYLYFADHKGDYIRLAYADRLEGPWKVHAPGSLQLSQSGLPTAPPPQPPNAAALLAVQGAANRAPPGTPGIPTLIDDATLPHIASPDVHVDEAGRRIIMYFHGLESFGVQRSRVATSTDGLNFKAVGGSIGLSYMRVFRHAGRHYAMAMPGVFSRSLDGLSGFETGPRLFAGDQRHSALLKRGNLLHVFWTRVGDAPERIYMSTIDLTPDWMSWTVGETIEVLRPERDWEGADLPVELSYRSAINTPVNQLRDPAIYEEDGRVYLLYAVKGEGGIAIAELIF
jgi:hypothetical protein